MYIFNELISLVRENNVEKVKKHCEEPLSVGQDNQPENKFKYELDRIITNTEITPQTKINFLLETLSKVSDNLKSVGIKFILGHELCKTENLYSFVKNFRRTNVTFLMASVDKLLSSKNYKEAKSSLEIAKDLPLYNMLKKDYLFKKKTKAVSKIEEKLANIKPLLQSK